MTPHISTPNPVGQHRSYTIWYKKPYLLMGIGNAIKSKFWFLALTQRFGFYL